MLTSECNKLRHDLRNAQDKVSLSLFLSNASGVLRNGINLQLVITLCSGPCLVITSIIMEAFYATVIVKLSVSTSRRNVGVTDIELQSFLALGLDGGEWSALCPSHFTRRERDPVVPSNRRLGGCQSWSGYFREKNFLPLLGIEPWIIQHIAQSLY